LSEAQQSAQTDLDGKYNAIRRCLTLFLCRNDRQNSGSRSSSTVNVILKEKLNFLDEVVVVACKQTAKSIVGSVVTIGKEVLGKQRQVF
jgi:hypothetical protein